MKIVRWTYFFLVLIPRWKKYYCSPSLIKCSKRKILHGTQFLYLNLKYHLLGILAEEFYYFLILFWNMNTKLTFKTFNSLFLGKSGTSNTKVFAGNIWRLIYFKSLFIALNELFEKRNILLLLVREMHLFSMKNNNSYSLILPIK